MSSKWPLHAWAERWLSSPVLQCFSVRALVLDKNLYLWDDFESETLGAQFDENQLGQVISNLVINAIQAMPEGGHLAVRAKRCTLSETNPDMPPPW